MDDQDDYREAADKAARGVPTPVPVALAYALSLLALITPATALIASGRFQPLGAHILPACRRCLVRPGGTTRTTARPHSGKQSQPDWRGT
ncbi:hypothetical protein ACGF13_10290 [Kitasatospora sp. NPDC048286]|uniref:hypothetical protein n=1 Tax=Kitasatospora sp. NPDC048286 TaxID=3364047 RepID=UPI00371632E7